MIRPFCLLCALALPVAAHATEETYVIEPVHSQPMFDVQHMMRTICQSRTYQHSVKSNDWNFDDTLNYSHAIPRRHGRAGREALFFTATARDAKGKRERCENPCRPHGLETPVPQAMCDPSHPTALSNSSATYRICSSASSG